MSGREHRYTTVVTWTGNTGTGTATYRGYERAHEIASLLEGKVPIAGSSDPAFRGDASRWNPEELLVASLSACHKLSYLHQCASAGVIVTEYVDRAEGTMEEDAEVGGRMTRVVLRPVVTIAPGSDAAKATELHHAAHRQCFIANSVNFPVACEPQVRLADA